jgi:hypothetical protein
MASTWNYRVIRHHDKKTNVDFHTIHEVYYHGEKPSMVSENPMHPFGETVEELKKDMELFMKAFDKPVLDWTVFHKDKKKRTV